MFLFITTSTDGADRCLAFGWPEVLTNERLENAISIAFGVERNSAMNRGNLADLNAFVAVADHLSFRGAASRLGVTPSALSHSIRQLEDRLGVRLLHRTTRSVSLTDAGLRLVERLRPAIGEIADALEGMNQERQRPLGRLRIYSIHLAAAAVIAPVWGRFLSTYPEVHLELAVGEAPLDIVANGFDAGIGPREWAAADMIAARVTGPNQGGGGWCAVILRAAATAAHARRSFTAQLCSISPGGARRCVQVAVRAKRQDAANFGGWPGDGQRSRFGCSRGG